MFQADSDFYQYTAATADGDSATTWQSTAEQVIPGGELIFHAQDGEGDTEGGMVGQTEEEEEGSEGMIVEEGRENGAVDTQIESANEAAAELKKEKGGVVECENQA